MESPGKWVWFLKVLDILVKGPEKSWNFLGYDVGNEHNDAGAGAKICENKLRFYLHIRKIAGGLGLAPDPIVTAVCLYIETSLAYDRVLEKCFWGPGVESPGNLCNQDSGNPA